MKENKKENKLVDITPLIENGTLVLQEAKFGDRVNIIYINDKGNLSYGYVHDDGDIPLNFSVIYKDKVCVVESYDGHPTPAYLETLIILRGENNA